MPKNSDGLWEPVRTRVNPLDIAKHINALNWKEHPQRQLNYVNQSIKDNGWARIPLYCANTKRLLDGHGRLEIALDEELRSIPIDVGYWTQEQGDELLASLDTTPNMASVDGNALTSLTEATLKRIARKQKSIPKIGMLQDVHAFAKQVADKKKKSITIRHSKKSFKDIVKESTQTTRDKRERHSDSDSPYTTELREDLLFTSESNRYGIPDLLHKMLFNPRDKSSKQTPRPTDTFSRSGRSLLETDYYCEGSRPFDSVNHLKPIGGFLGFFTEDRFFERYYRTPGINLERLVDERWFGILEPDYSTYWDWPFARRLWSVYRSRWAARYWQQFDLRIIPIIRRTNDIERDAPFLYDSLPESIPVACMQLRMGGKKNTKDTNYWNGIGAAINYVYDNKGLDEIWFYAEPKYEKYIIGKIPKDLPFHFITPFINKRMLNKKRKENSQD